MKIAIVLALLVLVLIGCAFLRVYYVADHSGATLFWKGDDAYLFLGAGSSGYRFRYLDYPMVTLRAYFNASLPPDDEHAATTVIHISPSGVERYQMDFGKQAMADFLTPFDDGFYAMCTGLTLCKWAGDNFKPATEDERRRLDGINRLSHGDMNNQIINGWSVRQLPRAPRAHFEVKIADKYSIYARDVGSGVRESPRISVELLRPGHPPENLYNVDANPRRVDKTEYKELFGGRSF